LSSSSDETLLPVLFTIAQVERGETVSREPGYYWVTLDSATAGRLRKSDVIGLWTGSHWLFAEEGRYGHEECTMWTPTIRQKLELVNDIYKLPAERIPGLPEGMRIKCVGWVYCYDQSIRFVDPGTLILWCAELEPEERSTPAGQPVACGRCNGKGSIDEADSTRCPRCGGTGKAPVGERVTEKLK
jgi:hypothetical protein